MSPEFLLAIALAFITIFFSILSQFYQRDKIKYEKLRIEVEQKKLELYRLKSKIIDGLHEPPTPEEIEAALGQPLTPYQVGARFERRIARILKKDGYFVSRQARSAFPDLITITRKGEPAFMECKVSIKLVKSDVERLKKLAEKYNVDAFMIHKNKTGKIEFVIVNSRNGWVAELKRGMYVL